MKKSNVTFASIALISIAFTFALGRMPLAAEKGEGASSSSCINCHTDLTRMDSYGAATAGAGVAIAG